MSQKSLFKYFNQYKWVWFISRPLDLLTVIANARTYGRHLKEIIGINYKAIVYLSKNNIVEYYRDEKEHLNFKKHLRRMILKNPNKILRIFEKAKKFNHQMRSEIKAYSSENNLDNKKVKDLIIIFKKKYNFFERQFATCTSIPYFIGVVEEELGLDDKNEKVKKIKKTSKELRLFSYQQYRDGVIEKIIQKISEKSGYKKQILDYLTPEEIISIGNNRLSFNPNRKRSGDYFYLRISKFEYLTFDKLIVKKISKLLKKVIPKHKSIISGQCGFKGKAIGRVKIVYSKQDFSKFNNGDILVTINSNPFLMPVIKKSAAIIADEGGITCHAAIVSRELKKPCIIGTKIATRVFKDGQLVEVDANRGVVRIFPPKADQPRTEKK